MTSDPTDLIRRLADEVEADVFATYGITPDEASPDDLRTQVHPLYKRKFDRDMAIVHEARRWIREHGGDDG